MRTAGEFSHDSLMCLVVRDIGFAFETAREVHQDSHGSEEAGLMLSKEAQRALFLLLDGLPYLADTGSFLPMVSMLLLNRGYISQHN